MKHIKTAFVLLAACFVSLSSFRSITKAKASEIRTFEFIGEPGVDEYYSHSWVLAEDEFFCRGQEAQICRITLLSDESGEYPDQSSLWMLLWIAENENWDDGGVYYAVNSIYGKVTVFSE